MVTEIRVRPPRPPPPSPPPPPVYGPYVTEGPGAGVGPSIRPLKRSIVAAAERFAGQLSPEQRAAFLDPLAELEAKLPLKKRRGYLSRPGGPGGER